LLYCKDCYSKGEICHPFLLNDSALPQSLLPINKEVQIQELTYKIIT